MEKEQANQSEICRRRFLGCLLAALIVDEGLCLSAEAVSAGKFFFADLVTGQLGFPCGYLLPAGMPGSVMKLVSAAALMDTRALSPDHKFECRGVYKVGNDTYKCLYPHGLIDLVQAIGLSCNIYFAQASRLLSAKTVLAYAARFGLNQPVAESASGRFPAKPAAGAARYALGLAEDLQPQALQILRLSALVAGAGRLPSFHSNEKTAGASEILPVTVPDLALSAACFQVLKEGMKMAGRQGTGKKLDPANKLKLAIKTGTTPHGTKFQSWLTGFFPWDAPRYAFVLRAAAGTSQDEAVPQARSFLFSTAWPL